MSEREKGLTDSAEDAVLRQTLRRKYTGDGEIQCNLHPSPSLTRVPLQSAEESAPLPATPTGGEENRTVLRTVRPPVWSPGTGEWAPFMSRTVDHSQGDPELTLVPSD